MINQTKHDKNFLSATNYVAPDINTNQKKTTTNVSFIAESEISESHLATSHTSTPNNESFETELIQRTIGPTNTDLIDTFRKKIEDEIANSPKCTVYFIPHIHGPDAQIRFTEVAKHNMYKAGISSEELDDAIKLSNETCIFETSYNSHYYVNNLKINYYLKNFFSVNINHCDIFEICYTERKKILNSGIWYPVEIIENDIINEIMLNPKYIKTSNRSYAKLTADTEKFITDKIMNNISQYLSATSNILIKELFSDKIPEKKIENLQAIISPDYLLSNDSSQKKTPLLSTESLLHRIKFSPYGIEFQSLLKNNPKYCKDTI